MNINLRLFFTRKKTFWCKSIHLFRSAINTSNIIYKPFDFRTLYNSSNKTSSNLTSHQPIRIKQTIGRLWRSQLTVIRFPSDEKKEITDESKLTCEQISLHSNKKVSINDLVLEVKRQITSAFMPKGYPDSVTKDYWEFAKWQFLHNIAGSVTGVLSTQSLLYAMGLGSTSIPLAAALNWIIKDGLGQLGGVIYAASINDRFDSEPKRHRFQATVAMQSASFLELLAPLWPGMFLLIASISNIGKNIAWLAGSATRAQMHKTFALRDNLGDITGKTGSQSTAAGTALGVAISATITKFQPDIATITSSTIAAVQPIIPIFLAFIPFSIFNIYANYKSSLYVTTRTLNIPRAEMILYRLLNQLGGETRTLSRIKCDLRDLVPSPKEISAEEIFVKRYYSPYEIPLVIEPALHHYTSKKYARDLHAALKQEGFLHSEEYFILHVPYHHLFGGLRKKRQLVQQNHHHHIHFPGNRQHLTLWFSQKANTMDLIKGFYHACTIRYALEYFDSATSEDRNHVLNIIQDTHALVEDSFTDLINTLESKEWEIEHLFFTEKDDHRLFVEK
ncbi:5424_t:CDS:2 [Funneliformis caledonium]|uniref:5424_t:CDS:1 n=1 Tax=Funneliformis caledonium TaxID=1117310 RepID=A0A9N9C841_9GLOM|nr:5424_t:CDS:2 [Funneliformis caledonium]